MKEHEYERLLSIYDKLMTYHEHGAPSCGLKFSKYSIGLIGLMIFSGFIATCVITGINDKESNEIEHIYNTEPQSELMQETCRDDNGDIIYLCAGGTSVSNNIVGAACRTLAEQYCYNDKFLATWLVLGIIVEVILVCALPFFILCMNACLKSVFHERFLQNSLSYLSANDIDFLQECGIISRSRHYLNFNWEPRQFDALEYKMNLAFVRHSMTSVLQSNGPATIIRDYLKDQITKEVKQSDPDDPSEFKLTQQIELIDNEDSRNFEAIVAEDQRLAQLEASRGLR